MINWHYFGERYKTELQGIIGIILVRVICHTASKPSSVIPSEVVSVTAGVATSTAGAPRVSTGAASTLGATASTIGASVSVKIRVPSLVECTVCLVSINQFKLLRFIPFINHLGWLVGLWFNVPVNNFSSCWDEATTSWVFTSTLGSLKCLAQGHYTATVEFEPWASSSGV